MDPHLSGGELAAGLLDSTPENAQVYAEYRRLAAEQAALRRLATLVAEGKHRRRCSTWWSTKCAAVCRRIPPDYGATSQVAKLRRWPQLGILTRRWRSGR